MKNNLYIATMLGLNDIMLDVFLIVGSDNSKIHARLDDFMDECNKYNAYGSFVVSYSFSKVGDFIDGYKIEII